MTPLHTAIRAEQKDAWADQGWRNPIKVSDGDAATSRADLWQTRCLNLLQTSFNHAQAGWKWLEQRRTQHLSSRRLRLAETISLGEKRSVSIVEVDGEQYLIGSSAASVQLLAVLNKQNGEATARSEERAS